MRVGLLAAGAALTIAAAPAGQSQSLDIVLDGLRSTRGQVMVCVTRSPAYFPDCSHDPDKRHLIVPARAGVASLGAVAPGAYAIAIVHDENGNGRLDTFAGIPREGVGFSRNPTIRFGAPSFRSSSFAVAGAPVAQPIRVKYFL